MAVVILAATIRPRCIAILLVNKMRIVRDYFGLDRTTVTYDSEITGVGGNAEDFFVVAEVTKGDGSPATRTVITFSHEEVARMLADYRCNHPIDARASPLLSVDLA